MFFNRDAPQLSLVGLGGPTCSLVGADRDGSLFISHFTAKLGWAVWLLPGVCWSWWRRKGPGERCWSACSHSRLSARRTASRDRPASGRCPDRTPPPTRKNRTSSEIHLGVCLYWFLLHYSWLQRFISLKTCNASVCPQQTMEIHDHLLSFTFDLAHSGVMEMETWLGKKTPKTPSGGQTCPHRDANIHQHRQK